jgi:hypothetical protein
MVNGLGRKTGFTASSRLTETLGKKLINPKSKLRKKMDRFELTGDFNNSVKKIRTLIEVFYEEYRVSELPLIQVETYYSLDIKTIDNKIEFLGNYVSNEDETETYKGLISLWNNVKNL